LAFRQLPFVNVGQADWLTGALDSAGVSNDLAVPAEARGEVERASVYVSA
jgi:hypothetical protein